MEFGAFSKVMSNLCAVRNYCNANNWNNYSIIIIETNTNKVKSINQIVTFSNSDTDLQVHVDALDFSEWFKCCPPNFKC